jgi:hypothetical protein
MPEVKHTKPERARILDQAKAHTCGDRDEEYGPPWVNLNDCAGLWSAYLSGKYGGKTPDSINTHSAFTLTAEDVAWFNVLQKMARTFSGQVKPDTYEDAAAYSAIEGECAKTESELE